MELVVREVFSALAAAFYGGLIFVALIWGLVEWLHAKTARKRRTEQYSGDHETPKTIVTLVHGTWARSAEWTLPDSDICRAIDQHLPPGLLFFRFGWSGRNSISARFNAAAALERKLEEMVARFPDADHFLIGHSHGGSVLLDSLKPGLAGKISGIICLATPVLIGQPRKYGPAVRQALVGIPMVLIFVFLAWLLAEPSESGSASVLLLSVVVAYVVGSVLLGMAVERGIEIARAPAAVIATFFVGAILLWLGAEESGWALKAGVLTVLTAVTVVLYRFVSSRAACWRSAMERSSDFPFLSRDKALFIRAPGDEASAVLITAHLLSWAVDRLSTAPIRAVWNANHRVEGWRKLVVQHWVTSVLAGAAAIVIAGYSLQQLWPWFSGAGSGKLEYQLLLSALIVSCTFLGTMIALLARGSGATWFLAWLASTVLLVPMFVIVAVLGLLTIGPEMVVVAFMMEITAESTPSGEWTLIQLSPDPSRKENLGLQHSSVYHDPRAIKIMCDWMLARSKTVKD